MPQMSHEAQQEYSSIIDYIKEDVTPLFMRGREYPEKIETSTVMLTEFDRANEVYKGIIHDSRENNKKMQKITNTVGCIGLDYLLLYNGLSILCDKSYLSWSIKISVPIFLVLAEIGISYSLLTRQRSIKKSKSGIVLQCTIICFLAAFSIYVVFVLQSGYNPQFDGDSGTGFLIKNVIIQLIMLVPAIFFHFWIIRHAYEIADAIAYFKYKWQRFSKGNNVKNLKQSMKNAYKCFVKKVQNLVEAIDAFDRSYPDVHPDFGRVVPHDLAHAINAVMGRVIFPINRRAENDKDNKNMPQ